MNWIRENKFLTGFIAILVIGTGVLGYLLYSAYGEYSDVTEQYTTAAKQLHDLQTLTPYPDQANLAKYKAELNTLKDATHELASNLSTMVLPIKEITPSGFQDQLRDTAAAIAAKSTKTGVKTPEKFALDFDQYQQQPPIPAAAGPLGRQLTAMDMVVNILLDNHVDAITSVSRAKLPEEGGAAAHPAGGPAANRPGPHPSGNVAPLVDKSTFDIKFTADQTAFQSVLNAFAASSKQFFVTRTLVLENTNSKPISKTTETPGAPGMHGQPGTPASAAPGAAATSGTDAGYLQFIVGTEKVDVAMRVEMVTFNPPEKSSHK